MGHMLSDTWQWDKKTIKAEHEIVLDRLWFYTESENAEIRELRGLESVSLIIKKGRMWRFRYTKCKDDAYRYDKGWWNKADENT